MCDKTELSKIRESERKSHAQIYAKDALYTEGNWLSKAIKTVTELFPHFEAYVQLNVLDLGCGVGRNSIAIARQFNTLPCRVDCVDLLEIAIEKLIENAEHYGVSQNIRGIIQPIENYPIPEEYYDWILAVSALEHVDSSASFTRKLLEIRNGLKKNGIVSLVINTEMQEFEKKSGKPFPPQFEINWSTTELEALLSDTFFGWDVIKRTVKEQRYEIPRENGIFELHTNVVTFVAKK